MTDGDRGLSLGFIIGTIFGLLIGIGVTGIANAAESRCSGTIVEYTSGDDLTARVAKVIGVCDTVRADSIMTVVYDGYSFERIGQRVEAGKIISITCRELICVTVATELKFTKIRTFYDYDVGGVSIDTMTVECLSATPDCKTTAGQAIVWWEEVKQ